jgi:hypothetical protein
VHHASRATGVALRAAYADDHRAIDEIDKRAGTLSEGGRRIAVLAMRLPLKTYPSVT